MNAKRNLVCWACLGCLILSHPGARAANAVDVTIEADETMLKVGESTVITVYGQVAATIEAESDQIFSWYVDVLNDDGGVAAGYASLTTPASDNTPSTSSDGTPEGANLRGIYDTFLLTPGAGKGARVALVRFEVTALSAGTATFRAAPGSTVAGGLQDFLVMPSAGGLFTGGIYGAASVAITVTGEPDFSGLDLRVSRSGQITFNPLAGFNHTVQYNDTLLPESWADLPGGPHNSGSVNQVITGVPQRYYRVVSSSP